MVDMMLRYRLAQFDMGRVSHCRLAWVEKVVLPAAAVVRATLRCWESAHGAYQRQDLRICVSVVGRCVRPFDMDARINGLSYPDETDAALALQAAGAFDPDGVDWTQVVTGRLGAKLNALRRKHEN